MIEIGILIGIIALTLLWIGRRMFEIYFMVKTILFDVKKGNKDQQEIKTRLTWLRKNLSKIITYYDL